MSDLRTFSIHTLGCRVNHYEAEQLAAVMRRWGLVRAASVREADVRIVHTCSVTMQAAGKSRQAVRRATRLPVIQTRSPDGGSCSSDVGSVVGLNDPSAGIHDAAGGGKRARVVVTGCWATGDGPEAAGIPGVDAVLGHHEDVAGELDRLMARWTEECGPRQVSSDASQAGSLGEEVNGWIDPGVSPNGAVATASTQPIVGLRVKKKNGKISRELTGAGMTSLPLLGERQGGHQRAFLKIQDGCDAHCTYCIIPQLRPRLWSKPVDEVVEEARTLVAAGHQEIVLTGIFIGAYGQETALRRRQSGETAGALAKLLVGLCDHVEGLRRLRVSSMEPGDLTDELIEVMRGLPQVVPHFHLPLQSGSDAMLRRMNRQYTRGDFLRMAGRVKGAWDRPALTTDVIVGFPGETDGEFARTVEVAEEVGFIHVHAFSYSPRPNTAAARWEGDFVRGPVVNERIVQLREIANRKSYEYRKTFLGEEVEILVEHPSVADEGVGEIGEGWRHGRCERYFPVFVPAEGVETGEAVRVRIERVTEGGTFGQVLTESGV